MDILVVALLLVACGFGITALHVGTHRWGWGPLFFAVGATELLMYYESGHLVGVSPGSIPLSSAVFFPLVLATILLVYVADGTGQARLLVGMVVTLAIAWGLHLVLVRGLIERGFLTTDMPEVWSGSAKIPLASLLALLLDLLVVVVGSQLLMRVFPSIPGPALFVVVLGAALFADALVFPLLSGRALRRTTMLGSHVPWKLGATILLALPFGWRMRRIPLVVRRRPVLDLFLPPFDPFARRVLESETAGSPGLSALEELYRGVARFGSALGLEETLGRIEDEGRRLFSTDVYILLREGDRLTSRTSGRLDLPIDQHSAATRALGENRIVEAREGEDDPVCRTFGKHSILAVPLGTDHETAGVLVLCRDRKRSRRLDERERALAAALAHHAALAIDRAQRTEEIVELNRRLQETESSLRRSQAELATYHDLVTHDISNFSTTLLGLIEALLGEETGPLTEEQIRLLKMANRQGWEMNRLAENAKLAVRLRESGLPNRIDAIDVDRTVASAVETVRAVHFDRNAELEVGGERGLHICGLPFFENVLVNLLDNAIRHSDRRRPTRVRVEIHRSEGRVRLEVAGGRPPTADLTDRLFSRWETRGPSGGSGLGLALVRTIVEGGGGRIEAGVTELAGESVFEVRLELLCPTDEGERPCPES